MHNSGLVLLHNALATATKLTLDYRICLTLNNVTKSYSSPYLMFILAPEFSKPFHY
jgi:hypothetical protein